MPPLASQIVNSPSTRIEPLLLIVIFAKLSSCMLKLSLFTEACSIYSLHTAFRLLQTAFCLPPTARFSGSQ